ncbi:MAG: peptidylprolyl isomerase [Alphaproteobacteria bacterium]
MELKNGTVVIELRPDLAPNHVARIKELTSDGFYDGIVFHRVIPGFMAQTGDPTGTGTGGSTKPDVAAEFSKENHVRGTVSMARSASPDSANSQFFICFGDCAWLDGQYSAFGKVVSGMEHIDAIKKGEGGGGEVSSPDSIVKMSLAE